MFVALNVKDKLSALCPAAVLRAGLVISSHPRVQENPVAGHALRPHALPVIRTEAHVCSAEVQKMSQTESYHLRLQRQIDCQLEVKPKDALIAWEKSGWNEESGTDGDEAPLKYLAMVLLEAIESRSVRLSIDRERGVTIFGDSTYMLPKAPSMYIARGLEILREIAGMDSPDALGRISLGIRNDSLELIIQKEAGLHIINIPGV